jgi:phosphatidylserine synthase
MAKVPVAKQASAFVEKKFAKTFKALYSIGITANHLTLIQAPMIILMVFLAYLGYLWHVLFLCALMLVIDLFDGPFARITKTASKRGHLYDKVVDLVSICAFAFSVGLLFPEVMLMSIVLILATLALYILNEAVKVEMWGCSRFIVPVGVVVGLVYPAVFLSVVITLSVISYDLYLVVKTKR